MKNELVLTDQLIVRSFTIISRGHMINVLEYAVEGTLTLESGIHTNLRDGLIRLGEQGTGILQPGLIEVAVEVPMEGIGEDPG